MKDPHEIGYEQGYAAAKAEAAVALEQAELKIEDLTQELAADWDAYRISKDACNKRIEQLEAALKHIHWSMGDKLVHSDRARDQICVLCDKALGLAGDKSA